MTSNYHATRTPYPIIGALTVSAALLAGCASQPEPAPTYTLEDDPAVAVLQDAVAHIERQNEILVQVERGERGAKPPTSRPDDVPALGTTIEMRNWSGTALEAVRAVADQISYQVNLSGARPPVAPLVSLAARGKDAWDVIYDIADQAERALDLRIDVDREIVTIAYRDREG